MLDKDKLLMVANNAMKAVKKNPSKKSAELSAGTHTMPNGMHVRVTVRVDCVEKGGSHDSKDHDKD